MQSILGITVMILFVWFISEKRNQISWKSVGFGLLAQLILAVVFIKVHSIGEAFLFFGRIVEAIEIATSSGTQFVFGYLGGGDTPFEVQRDSALYIFGFRVLPQILVFSVLVALMWHWGILPRIVQGLGNLLKKALNIGGPLGTGAAATIFLGLAESPLVIRGYLDKLSRADLFTLMVCSMSTVAGSVMLLYASILSDILPGAPAHILGASIINMLGAVVFSRILMPFDEVIERASYSSELRYSTTMDAISRGTTDGLQLVLNIGAMLIVLLSLVALLNQMISWIPGGAGGLSLQGILGWLFAPIAWLIGIPWAESEIAGSLLGTKLILNELVAFIDLASLEKEALSEDSYKVLTYVLCGFANFGSLGILIAGYTTLLPERRHEVLELGLRTLGLATLVNCHTGAIVGLVSQF